MKIVFMGTPDFAVGILEKLVAEQLNVVAVVTAPDKPAGRGKKLSESAVKVFAASKGLRTLQPSNLKDETFVEELKSLGADLFVVVAFRMLPEVVWKMPSLGTINLHASLLPQYRGAAPINWAIINGEKTTGVTTFFIEQEIDTGMVIERSELPIDENETAGELHDKLLELGKDLVYQSVIKIQTGKVQRVLQESLTSELELKPAPKIFKPMCQIDYTQTATQVHNFCRGLSPYPTAWTVFENRLTAEKKSIKIFRTHLTDLPVSDPSEIKSTKHELLLPCSDFYIAVTELQPEGKRRMKSSEFMAGYSVSDWNIG